MSLILSRNLALLLLAVLTAPSMTLGLQEFASEPPSYSYDSLPKTSFTCDGKLPGRYYADPETDCQMFHICVRMSKRDVQKFSFLCPNSTSFDQEHLVCNDYYQVVCHSSIGTNPLGQIFEIMKLTSGHRNLDLDFGKVPAVDPDFLARNSLNEEESFQAAENNNNRLAESGNALNFSPSKPLRQKQIFVEAPSSTTTTEAPLFFRGPNFERNLSNRGKSNNPIEDPFPSSTTGPFSASVPIVSTPSSISQSPARTFQQQSSRFGDDFFRKIPPTIQTKAISKAAQFYVSTNTDNYTTPEFRQPTSNPFTSTTRRPQQFFSTTFEPVRVQKSSTTTDPTFDYQTASTQFPTRHQNNNFQAFNRFTGANAEYDTTTYRSQNTQTNADFFYTPSTTLEPPRSRSVSSGSGRIINTNEDDDGFFKSTHTFTSATSRPPTTSKATLFQKIAADNRPKQDKVAIFFVKNTQKPYIDELERETPGPSAITYFEPVKTTSNNDNNYYSTSVDYEYRTTTTTQPPTTEITSQFPTEDYSSTEPSTTVITSKPQQQRRGGRRRVKPNRPRDRQKQFDPQLKYARRTEISRLREFNQRDSFSQNEEIFSAEASVFPGRPKSNNFFDEKKKDEETKKDETTTTTAPRKQTGDAFGRRIRPFRREHIRQQQQAEVSTTQLPTTPQEEKATQAPRLIKRLRKPKTTTTQTTEEPTTVITSVTSSSTTTTSSTASPSPKIVKVFTGASTLRPVTRVSVKTKTRKNNGQHNHFPQNIPLPQFAQPFIFPKDARTEEPELVTASVEQILLKKKHTTRPFDKKLTTQSIPSTKITTTTTPKPFVSSTLKIESQNNFNNNNNGTRIIVKVTSNSSPISITKPILPSLVKKGQRKQKFDVVSSSEDGAPTRSPDYDYTYYNTDDETDYVDRDRQYGRKAKKNLSQ